MKSLITTVALLASSTLAAQYAAGTNCHSNVECEKNCVDKQYTIVNEDGGYIFACDSGVADPTEWYNLRCETSIDMVRVSLEATTAACEQAGGQVCSQVCVLSDKRSVDEDNRNKWTGSCGRDADGYQSSAKIFVMKDESDAKALC